MESQGSGQTTFSSLQRPGAILLISCYELGHQPLAIAQPLGFFEEAGYQPRGLDVAIESLDDKAVSQAQLIGIAVPMHTALRLGVQVAKLCRQLNASCHICFFGLYASLNAEYLLQQVADSVIGAESEALLVELVKALEMQGGHRIEELDGVSVRGRISNPVLGRLPANIPVPTRRALPLLSRYAKLEHQGRQRLVGYVEASRGCLHHCLHCPIVPVYKGRLILIPETSVLEDIRNLVKAGATHITFGDPDFLNGPGHSMKVLRAMHAEFPSLTFDFTAKIEHILERRSLFEEMRSLGCLFVISAVESFSDSVLDRLHKGHTREDILEALAICRAASIALRPSLVAFTPWTSLVDYIEMLEMVMSHDLIDAVDPVQYTIRLLVPPGSALLDHSDISTFLHPLDQANFQYPWSHPDARMDRLHELVTAAVQKDTKKDENSEAVFDRLRELAYELAGRPAPIRSHGRFSGREKAPRLTESWFCCAEPTQEQLRPLRPNGHEAI
jgi:radical SAM superfamily enzyme YgiQ (UPF0313 family)